VGTGVINGVQPRRPIRLSATLSSRQQYVRSRRQHHEKCGSEYISMFGLHQSPPGGKLPQGDISVKLTIILRTLRHSSSYTPIDYCSLKRPDIIEYR
jgi:hypothetical protein